MDYKTSGVDIEAGREFVSEIKQAVEGTHTSNVIEGIGGFWGLFRIPVDGFKKPVLVSGTDGVGTKLELSFFAVEINFICPLCRLPIVGIKLISLFIFLLQFSISSVFLMITFFTLFLKNKYIW